MSFGFFILIFVPNLLRKAVKVENTQGTNHSPLQRVLANFIHCFKLYHVCTLFPHFKALSCPRVTGTMALVMV